MDIKCVIAKGLKIVLNPPALNNCKIDKTAKVCPRSEITSCSLGRYSYIGQQCFMVNVVIGGFCSIADRCSIGGAVHPMTYVSSSPVFHEGKNILRKNFSNHGVVHTPGSIIENDVWIGQGAFIKAGVHIESGAVVGMGSIVVNDIGSYEIWAGNPARFIRKRFDDNTIERLLDIRWWDWKDEYIEKYAEYFDDPKRLFEALKDVDISSYYVESI